MPHTILARSGVDVALLDRLFSRSPGFAAVVTGSDHVFVYANQSYARLVGDRDIIGKPVRDALPELVGQDLLVRLDRVNATGEPYTTHAHPIPYMRDGIPRSLFVDLVFQPVLGDKGEILGILAQGYDVTRLVRAEAALQESEAHYRHTVEHLPQMTWLAAADGTILSPNPAWAQRTGRPLEEAVGSGWQSSVHPDDLPGIIAAFEAAHAAKTVFDAKHRVRMADGQYRWVRIHARPRLDDNGEILRWYGVNTDIHDEVVTQQRLEESERRFRAEAYQERRAALESDARLAAIVSSSPDAIISFSPDDGRIMSWNDGAEALFGYAPSEAIGQVADLLVAPLPALPDGEGPRGLYDRAMAGEATTRDTVRVAKDGSLIDVSVTACRMLAADGTVLGVAAVMRDIRARKRAEADLKEALRAKDVLLYEVNHRVKNSLQLVTSLLLIEASKIADPDARGVVMNAREKITTISKLHQRLYADGSHDTVDFATFLKDLVDGLTASSGTAGSIVAEVIDEGSQPLSIRFAAPLAMAASELLMNAIKYAFPDRSGRIDVRFSVGDEVSLSVADDGVGLAPGFDPATAPTTGMQIITGLVRQIGGRFELDRSRPGTAFRITVPLEDAA